ncbi:MAG: diacylglycerol/lipid kinase family protein [Planctomycetota bacterium]
MPSRQILAIVNPRSGSHQATRHLDQLKAALLPHGLLVHTAVTERPGHAQELAAAANPREIGCLCAVGGDGTIHEVVNGLMQRPQNQRIPLAVLAAGTGNALALQYQLQSPADTAHRILSAITRPLDVIHVTAPGLSAYCINIVGWGAATDINAHAEKLRWIGRSRYSVAALWQILKPTIRPARLTLDGHPIEGPFLFAIACNTMFAAHRMLVAPEARSDDGLLDVVLLRPTSRWNLLQVFQRVADGSHLQLSGIELHRASTLTIDSSTIDPLNLDGELRGHTPFSATVVPGALEVMA